MLSVALVAVAFVAGTTPGLTTEILAAQSIANARSTCRVGDRGRLIAVERVASHPTAASVQAYFDEWVAFYQDFYQFPDLAVTFSRVTFPYLLLISLCSLAGGMLNAHEKFAPFASTSIYFNLCQIFAMLLVWATVASSGSW